MFEIYANIEQKRFTYSDYAAMDDDKRYELIDGKLIMSPAPSSPHQDVILELSGLLNNFIKKNKIGKVKIAPYDVILDEINTVQPDIFVIKKEYLSKNKKNAFYGVPDLVIEIISPNSVIRDRYMKKELYEKHGVQEYWLIDTDKKSVEVFNNTGTKFDLFSVTVEKGKIESRIFPELEIIIEDIFLAAHIES